MHHIVHIEDDFDLEKIRLSGQCFRVSRLSDGSYRFIAGGKVLVMRDLGEGDFEVSCTPGQWRDFWHGYFDLDRNYAEIRNACRGRSSFLDSAMDYGRGLRILRQDPWEMLVTFIVSQRKSMPAIAGAVEALSKAFGAPIDEACANNGEVGELEEVNGPFQKEAAECGEGASANGEGEARLVESDGPLHAFPTPTQLAKAGEGELRGCSLGYRAPYISETAKQVAAGEIDLDSLADMADAELFRELQKAYGVGPKVANCVCLFGYGRTSQVPVDVWIARAIEEECEGEDPFAQFGEYAGIMQQYAFFYMTDRNRRPGDRNRRPGDRNRRPAKENRRPGDRNRGSANGSRKLTGENPKS